jgi:hypothetical protein
MVVATGQETLRRCGLSAVVLGQDCQALPGAGLDAAIGQLMIDTLTPLAVEAAHRRSRARAARRLRRPATCRRRRTRPLPRRPDPPPLPGRRPRQPARRRDPGSRLERCAARTQRRQGHLRQGPERRHRHPHATPAPERMFCERGLTDAYCFSRHSYSAGRSRFGSRHTLLQSLGCGLRARSHRYLRGSYCPGACSLRRADQFDLARISASRHLTRQASSATERLSAMILLSLANDMADIERENAAEIIRVLLEASRNTAVMNDHPQDVETAAKTQTRHIPDGRAGMKDQSQRPAV